MDDWRWLTENINTGMGALALAGATYAANWARKVVKVYLNYLEAKMARWVTPEKAEAKSTVVDRELPITVIAAINVIREIFERRSGSLENVPAPKRSMIVDQAYEIIKAALPDVKSTRFLKILIATYLFKGGSNGDSASG